jgi:hypothetical protein
MNCKLTNNFMFVIITITNFLPNKDQIQLKLLRCHHECEVESMKTFRVQ